MFDMNAKFRPQDLVTELSGKANTSVITHHSRLGCPPVAFLTRPVSPRLVSWIPQLSRRMNKEACLVWDSDSETSPTGPDHPRLTRGKKLWTWLSGAPKTEPTGFGTHPHTRVSVYPWSDRGLCAMMACCQCRSLTRTRSRLDAMPGYRTVARRALHMVCRWSCFVMCLISDGMGKPRSGLPMLLRSSHLLNR